MATVKAEIKKRVSGGWDTIHPQTEIAQITDIDSLTIDNLNDISDVNAPSPDNGDALIWDNTTSKWIPGAVSADTSDFVTKVALTGRNKRYRIFSVSNSSSSQKILHAKIVSSNNYSSSQRRDLTIMFHSFGSTHSVNSYYLGENSNYPVYFELYEDTTLGVLNGYIVMSNYTDQATLIVEHIGNISLELTEVASPSGDLDYNSNSSERQIWHSGNFDPDTKVSKSGDTMTGDLTIAKNNAVLIFKDTSTPDNNNLAAWISFKDQNNSEKGWMGYGYTTDTNMTFSNTIGNINLTPGGKVGIGTTSPETKLKVLDTANYGSPTLGTNSGNFSVIKTDSAADNVGDYGLLMGVDGTGDSWIQVQRVDGTATAYNLQLQPSGGTVKVGGNTVWHAGNLTNLNQLTNGPGYITSADGGDAETLDGLDSTSFEWYKNYTLDLSSLDESTYYPVTMGIGDPTRLRIEVRLNSGTTPSWSTHAGGFSIILDWTVNGYGWGTIPVERRIHQWTESFTNVTIAGGITQMGNSSNEVVYLRGGGKYFLRASKNITPTIRTSSFTQYSQTVAPTTSVVNNVFEQAAGKSSYNLLYVNDKIGIGTTSPTDKLDVFGDLSIYGNKIYNGSAANSAGMSLSGSAVTLAGYNDIIFKASASTIAGQTERMRIKADTGNVGIGTASPGAPLTVSAASTQNVGTTSIINTFADGGRMYPGLKVINTYSNHSYGTVAEFRTQNASGSDRPSILFSSNHSSNTWTVGQGGYSANDNFAITHRTFHPNDSSGWGTARLVIDTSGNVGIGTTSPSNKLQVDGNARVTNFMAGDAAATNTPEKPIHIKGSGTQALRIEDTTSSNQVYDITTDFTNGFKIENVTSSTTPLTIKNDGNVGIGTTSPNTKLDVRGGIQRNNTRVDSNERYPLGHYTPGETVFEIDPTWSQDELRAYFNSNSVSWEADSSAPGGYSIKITGNPNFGGQYGSGFPYIPIDQDDEFYMEMWIRSESGAVNSHYLGSNEYNQSFSSLGGNPGSFGYWVMSNTQITATWTKVSGYIGGFSNNIGDFESGTKYWTPMMLANYTNVSGARTSYISGWKVIKVTHPGNRNFTGTIANPSMWVNNGTNSNNYNENLRLFNAPNGVSVIAFGASGTGGRPQNSMLGYSDRFEWRVANSDTWRARLYSSGLQVNGTVTAGGNKLAWVKTQGTTLQSGVNFTLSGSTLYISTTA